MVRPCVKLEIALFPSHFESSLKMAAPTRKGAWWCLNFAHNARLSNVRTLTRLYTTDTKDKGENR